MSLLVPEQNDGDDKNAHFGAVVQESNACHGDDVHSLYTEFKSPSCATDDAEMR